VESLLDAERQISSDKDKKEMQWALDMGLPGARQSGRPLTRARVVHGDHHHHHERHHHDGDADMATPIICVPMRRVWGTIYPRPLTKAASPPDRG